MKKIIRSLPILFILFFQHILMGQSLDICEGSRLIENIFEDSLITTVFFGSNLNENGQVVDLYADVYEPLNDNAESRPLVIWVFGGSFIDGDRSIMEPYCMDMVKKGFVSATIDYRLSEFNILDIPDSIASFNIITRAVSDVKAAIRYFRYTIEEEGNPFNIDSENIFLGGISSGSIAAIQAAVLDSDDEENIPEWVTTVINNNGGFSGNTSIEEYGEYSDQVKAVINYAGAILDTSWIDENDPPILGIHGDMDENVDIGDGFAKVFFFEIIELHGSKLIATRQNNLGVENIFYNVSGADHYSLFLDPMHEVSRIEFRRVVQLFLREKICGELPLGVIDNYKSKINIFPNPVTSKINLQGTTMGVKSVFIHDSYGRIVYQKDHYGIDIHINIEHLNSGYYIISVINDSGSIDSRKFLKL